LLTGFLADKCVARLCFNVKVFEGRLANGNLHYSRFCEDRKIFPELVKRDGIADMEEINAPKLDVVSVAHRR
jgi:hypothetical protein